MCLTGRSPSSSAVAQSVNSLSSCSCAALTAAPSAPFFSDESLSAAGHSSNENCLIFISKGYVYASNMHM